MLNSNEGREDTTSRLKRLQLESNNVAHGIEDLKKRLDAAASPVFGSQPLFAPTSGHQFEEPTIGTLMRDALVIFRRSAHALCRGVHVEAYTEVACSIVLAVMSAPDVPSSLKIFLINAITFVLWVSYTPRYLPPPDTQTVVLIDINGLHINLSMDRCRDLEVCKNPIVVCKVN